MKLFQHEISKVLFIGTIVCFGLVGINFLLIDILNNYIIKASTILYILTLIYMLISLAKYKDPNKEIRKNYSKLSITAFCLNIFVITSYNIGEKLFTVAKRTFWDSFNIFLLGIAIISVVIGIFGLIKIKRDKKLKGEYLALWAIYSLPLGLMIMFLAPLIILILFA